MADIEGTYMTFRKTASNMSPKNKTIYTKAGGVPYEGWSYSIVLYLHSNRIAQDKKNHLWESYENYHPYYNPYTVKRSGRNKDATKC